MRKAQSPAELGFTGHDRRRLAKALDQVREAKVYQRIQAVLLIAQGSSVDGVAHITGSQRRSIDHWVQRYLSHHCVADLSDAPRSGRPRAAGQITPIRLLRELARDPLNLGYNTTVWTTALLARHLSQRYASAITPRTLRRRMKELGLRWKRPRYVYATKDPHRAQKKGPLCAG